MPDRRIPAGMDPSDPRPTADAEGALGLRPLVEPQELGALLDATLNTLIGLDLRVPWGPPSSPLERPGAGMICLSCGGSALRTAALCGGCGELFPVHPPHPRTNHICQLQSCLIRASRHMMDPPELGRRAERFLELVATYQEAWGAFDAPSLGDRAHPGLPREVHEALADLDLGRAWLLGAVETLLAWGGDPSQGDLLEEARLQLDGFFRTSCRGASALLARLDGLEPSSGDLIDVAT